MIHSKWVLSALVLLLFAHAVSAASGGSISFSGKGGSGADFCNDANLDVNFSFTADQDDGGGNDWVAIVFVDSNGVPLDVDFLSYPPGPISGSVVTEMGSINDITARPVTGGLFDISSPGSLDPNSMDAYTFATSGKLLAQASFDPWMVAEGACEDLPLQPPFVLTSGAGPKAANFCLAIPNGSVVGNMAFPTQAYYAPGKTSPEVIINPGTYWVVGQDEDGEFYKILLACQYLWVPIEAMQPSFEAPWNGQPLPTTVVQ